MGPGFSLDTPPRRVVAPRSPTVAAPGTPEEIRRAFGGPIAFAPGASREHTASAALRLAGPRFGPGEYAEHQRSIGVNQDQAGDGQGLTGWQVLAMPMVVHAMAGRLRQAQQAAAENVRPGGAGFPEAYLGGQSKMLVPGINGNVSNQTLGAQRVGQGVRSSGMTTGGTFGSSVMLGPGPGGESPTRQPFAYKPGRGPTITSPGGQSGVVSPEAFQQMWNQMSGNARGGALRMALADQRKLAAADPRIAANIARNEAAQQRQQGGAPIVTDPEQRQAMWNREMQRKELSRAGVPRPLAATLANLHGNPEAQAALVEQLAGEETGGQRGRERAGAGVTGVVAAQATARDAAARQKLEGDKLRLDQIKAQWGPRLQMAQAALMPGSTATPAERRAAQQTIDEYNRLTFTDSAFGGRQVMPPSQPGTQQLGQPGTNTSAPIPPEYVPYGSSGVMVDPQSVTQLETIAANYSANPAAVGAQLVQMMNGPEFAHLDAAKKQALLQDLVGRYRPNPTLAHPEGIYGGNRGPSFDGGSMEALGFAGGIM